MWGVILDSWLKNHQRGIFLKIRGRIIIFFKPNSLCDPLASFDLDVLKNPCLKQIPYTFFSHPHLKIPLWSTVWTSNVVPAEIVLRPPWRPPAGGDFLAKSMVVPAIFTKFKLIAHKFKLAFCIYDWNYQWFSQKIQRPPRGGSPGGSPDDFRQDNIDGPHGILRHVVNSILIINNLESWIF